MNTRLNTEGTVALHRPRVLDYITLTKPELTLLSVATAIAGYYLAATAGIDYTGLVHVFVGTLLVGAGAGALNQLIEREHDGLMRRTENRPLPTGRLAPWQVLAFGSAVSVGGLAHLTFFTNTLTAFLGALTLTSYLFLYTPLKRLTPLSTVVGGIPGALPPMMGWAAARNEISLEAWVLFAILFLWQMPHFYSLAWMYRRDYARAGFPMLTVVDESGRRTARQILLYCIGLVFVGSAPFFFAMTGGVGLAAGMALGLAFLTCAVGLWATRSNQWARRVFFVSLLYLPLLFALMSLDKS